MNVQMIDLKDMKVDMSYQRIPNEKRVKSIADKWDDMMANLIHVSKRADGYYVMDGNHTRLAYERIGGTSLPCRIYEGLTPKEEAEIFSELNSSQKKPTFNELLKAKAAAGKELESSYFKLLNEANIPYTFGDSTGCKIKCHSALLTVYSRTTYALMLRAVNVAKRAADDREEFYKVGFFPGLCSVVTKHPQVDDWRLISSVRKTSASKIREMSDMFRRGTTTGTNSATANFRKAFITIYNKGLRSNRIEE